MIGLILGILFAIVISIFLLLKFVFGNKTYWDQFGVYTIPNYVLGTARERLTVKVPMQFMDKRAYDHAVKEHKVKYAGTIMFRHPALFVYDLDLIKSITIKDFDHFTDRKVFTFPKTDQVLNQMLINQDGQDWKDLRTTMSPTFTTGKIRRMFNIFNESSIKMVEFLKQELKTNSDGIELRDVCGRFTMDVIASSAFGVDSLNFKDKNSVFATKGKKFQDTMKPNIILKIALVILFPKLYEILGLQFFDIECIEFFKDIVISSIKHRQETGEKRDDFLQLMLEAQAGQLITDDNTGIDEDSPTTTGAPNGKKITVTNELILAQCTLFFLAGFDVMETLLMFTAYELACNPEIQDRLYEEISSAVEGNSGKLSYDTVNNLEYLEMVVSETLRKYPAAVRGERKCTIDYKVPDTDFTIKKGTHIIIPIYGIHYDEKYYPEPERFDPERFTAENQASRHAAAYLPFGLGPRNCIARRFALIEAKTAIANLVLNFIIEPCEKTLIPMKFSPKGFIKPLGGMWLNLHSRNHA